VDKDSRAKFVEILALVVEAQYHQQKTDDALMKALGILARVVPNAAVDPKCAPLDDSIAESDKAN
jgi:hypothetical protein